jgi:tetratricopeptide (TPR) repeat protein
LRRTIICEPIRRQRCRPAPPAGLASRTRSVRGERLPACLWRSLTAGTQGDNLRAEGEVPLPPAVPDPATASQRSAPGGDQGAVFSLPPIELELVEAEAIARRRQRDGRLGAAASLYGRILEAAPDHLEALLALGGFVLRAGHPAEACQLFEKAASARPDSALAQVRLGAAYSLQGRLAEAEAALLRAIALDPGLVEAHRNLGVTLHRQGRLDEAAKVLRQALTFTPVQPEVERNLAAVLLDDGQAAEAAALYRRSLARQAGVPAGHLGLGRALRILGDGEGAAAALEQAIALAPKNPRALLEMGRLRMAQGQVETAIDFLRRAGELGPNDGTVQTALAEALIADQQIGEAAKACERAVAADPSDVAAMLAFAQLLDCLDHSLDLVAVLRQAVAQAPESKAGRRSLAAALLKSGDFAAGWPAREAIGDLPDLGLPLWQGEAIPGKRLLVEAGDDMTEILLLARLLPALADSGARLYLRCRPALSAPFAQLPRLAGILAPGEAPPACDLGVHLANLPRLLELSAEAIPPGQRWLSPSPAHPATWSAPLEQLPKPRIGLVWRSASNGLGGDRRANLPLPALARLVCASRGSFVALNPGDSRADIEAAGLSGRILDLGSDISLAPDWGAMAAVIETLDLLISVDSPAAHLSGALGRPTVLLLAQPSAWWWFRERGDSPWYPSLRLLRQATPGAWEGVVDELIAQLDGGEAS